MAPDETDDPQALRERVGELEDRLTRLTQAEDVAVDQDGRQWTLGDLMNIGLTRREAMLALSALVGGAALPYAISTAVTTEANAQSGAVGQIGTSDESVDVYGATVDADSLNTVDAEINGNQVYVQGSQPSSPSTGDIWIDNDG